MLPCKQYEVAHNDNKSKAERTVLYWNYPSKSVHMHMPGNCKLKLDVELFYEILKEEVNMMPPMKLWVIFMM